MITFGPRNSSLIIHRPHSSFHSPAATRRLNLFFTSANKVQGERRAELARAMLSRSLYSLCISKCTAKIRFLCDISKKIAENREIFPRKSARFSRRLCLCCVQTLEGARPKGAPLLCRVWSDDVQTMHARRAERHEQNSTFYFSTFYYKPFEGSDII